MAVNPHLLEVLRCPNCRSEVRISEDHKSISCLSEECGLIFPVKDDIPVMIVEEATKPEASDKRK